MNKKKKLIQALILSLVLLCGICIGTGAAGTAQKVTATLDPGVTITVDGVPQQFVDANGNQVYPILYNGSTYLPMRAVCEQLAGFKVGWDQSTRTASIATKDVDGTDLLDMQKAYYLTDGGNDLWARQTMTSDKKTTEVNGYTLTHWLEFYSWTFKKTGMSSMASFNIEGKYDTVTFRYYGAHDAKLEVIGDNDSVLWTKDIKGSQLYQEVTVDLMNTNQLTFKSTNEDAGTMSSFIYDVRLK